jgi:DNA-directed RNA polymerase specialized sigma24 family protein
MTPEDWYAALDAVIALRGGQLVEREQNAAAARILRGAQWVASRYALDSSAAEDSAQRATMKLVLEHKFQGSSVAALRRWLITTIVHLQIDQTRSKETPTAQEDASSQRATLTGAEASATGAEEAADHRQALARLSRLVRKVLLSAKGKRERIEFAIRYQTQADAGPASKSGPHTDAYKGRQYLAIVLSELLEKGALDPDEQELAERLSGIGSSRRPKDDPQEGE